MTILSSQNCDQQDHLFSISKRDETKLYSPKIPDHLYCPQHTGCLELLSLTCKTSQSTSLSAGF